ncbi:hypothetical protein C0Q70_18312 [Pomacea canaliculata]|uniref:LRAT domain-containing protein n=1 Tax=Pomacea canaliculata TaxID=400727 RepID=A0A2T7NMV6_POMCA|nr:HRAS-like suppressor 2 [Pomacea canaliculata]PVD22498.1 hypothetical protein C0Q70_18312 [Pomacea canaliculata]
MTNSKEFSLNHELVLELELGDIVEFPRENYSHFGIYVGDGNVIHALAEDTIIAVCGKALSRVSYASSSSSGITMKTFIKGTVIQQNFFDVAKKSVAKKNNLLDGKIKPLSPKKIVEKAKSMMEKSCDYDLLKTNCEHFATWCRYGIGYSKQTNSFCLNAFPPSIEEAIPDTRDFM